MVPADILRLVGADPSNLIGRVALKSYSRVLCIIGIFFLEWVLGQVLEQALEQSPSSLKRQVESVGLS